ncbi:MAG: hypothetical protein EXS08_16370 [Planctomycetes bacterium]|nr:hypothetical protein [Planctomycetota bacterium]
MNCHGVALLFLSCSCLATAAQQARSSPTRPSTPGKLLLSGYNSNGLYVYRTADGTPRGFVPSVRGAQSIVLGSDGLLYVCAEKVDQVVRIDPQTRVVLDVFVGDDPLTAEDENGPLDGPTAACFGPQGDLFVTSFENDQVLRFDGQSGAYEGVFVASASGGLDGPDAGTKWGPDGLLYVPSFWNDRVLRYNADGSFASAFIPNRRGGLRQPRDLVWHDGLWYVASSFNNRVLRYDAAGNFVDRFCDVNQPYCVAFHPLDGNLYVVSLGNNAVRVFDGASGDPLSPLVTAGAGGIDGAVYLYFLQ